MMTETYPLHCQGDGIYLLRAPVAVLPTGLAIRNPTPDAVPLVVISNRRRGDALDAGDVLLVMLFDYRTSAPLDDWDVALECVLHGADA